MQLERLSRLDSETDEDQASDLELLTVRSRINTRRVSEEEAEHLKALKRIKDALGRFDLSKNEVRVYLYLARFGAQKAQRIAEALSVHRTEAYKILRRLEKQGLARPLAVLPSPMTRVVACTGASMSAS